MHDASLESQLDAFGATKARLIQELKELRPWLEGEELLVDDARHAIDRGLEALAGDSVTVAVVGEFSRGKTELINALFFTAHGQRLLPADAGRTTMCPAEIFFDPDEPISLLLLPVETRLTETGLSELRRQTDRWIRRPLDLSSPEELASSLRALTETVRVSPEEARRLGLIKKESKTALPGQNVEVPRWRHAMVNVPHPLLESGLRIIDTPGFNAIGIEPELTFELLPSAQATLFVLGADTGVTRSDLEMWQEYLHSGRVRQRQQIMVVLNKVDTLWDELRDDSDVNRSLQQQINAVASVLGVDTDAVFPLSAQKALLARIRGDAPLEARSGITRLEERLGSRIVDSRQQILVGNTMESVTTALNGLIALTESRLTRARRVQQELAELDGQSDSVVTQQLRHVQQEKTRYDNNLAILRSKGQAFGAQGDLLLRALSADKVQASVASAQRRMLNSWTTFGLKQSMQQLFDELRGSLDAASEHSKQARTLVRSLYRRFQTEHGFEVSPPQLFSLMAFQVELKLLHEEAETFRQSPRVALLAQQRVVKRFFDTLVSRVEALFSKAESEARTWVQGALQPLATQVREHRKAMDQQVHDLKDSSHSRVVLQQRIGVLGDEIDRLGQQLDGLEAHRRGVTEAGSSSNAPARPYLVKGA